MTDLDRELVQACLLGDITRVNNTILSGATNIGECISVAAYAGNVQVIKCLVDAHSGPIDSIYYRLGFKTACFWGRIGVVIYFIDSGFIYPYSNAISSGFKQAKNGNQNDIVLYLTLLLRKKYYKSRSNNI